MRTKIVSLLLIIILSMTAVIGCGKKNQSTDEDSAQVAVEETTEDSNGETVIDGDKTTDDYTIKVGYGGSLCEAPIHIAYEKGYFKEQGINVELIKLNPGTGFDAITTGKVDVNFALLASLVDPLSNGLPAKITTGVHTGCDKVLVKADSSIKTAKDFVGKKVGVASYTASPYVFLRRVLADNGVGVTVENSEVEFVVYGAADLPLALENGAVDAIAMNDPSAYIAANEYGFTTLFNSATDKPYDEQYCCSIYMRNEFIEAHPELAEKYTTAIQKASAWVQENQEETAKIQVENEWVAGDAVGNAEVLKTFNYIPSAKGAYEAFEIVANQMQEIGMVNEDVDIDKLVTNSFKLFEGLPEEFK